MIRRSRFGARHSKQGRRADLDNQSFRSSWEANIARWLNFLQHVGPVVSWSYEPRRFEFPGITRGCYDYLPDFHVMWADKKGEEYVEVKGYMDKKSATRLKRMKKFYPEVKVTLIGPKEYRAIERSYRGVIKGWE